MRWGVVFALLAVVFASPPCVLAARGALSGGRRLLQDPTSEECEWFKKGYEAAAAAAAARKARVPHIADKYAHCGITVPALPTDAPTKAAAPPTDAATAAPTKPPATKAPTKAPATSSPTASPATSPPTATAAPPPTAAAAAAAAAASGTVYAKDSDECKFFLQGLEQAAKAGHGTRTAVPREYSRCDLPAGLEVDTTPATPAVAADSPTAAPPTAMPPTAAPPTTAPPTATPPTAAPPTAAPPASGAASAEDAAGDACVWFTKGLEQATEGGKLPPEITFPAEFSHCALPDSLKSVHTVVAAPTTSPPTAGPAQGGEAPTPAANEGEAPTPVGEVPKPAAEEGEAPTPAVDEGEAPTPAGDAPTTAADEGEAPTAAGEAPTPAADEGEAPTPAGEAPTPAPDTTSETPRARASDSVGAGATEHGVIVPTAAQPNKECEIFVKGFTDAIAKHGIHEFAPVPKRYADCVLPLAVPDRSPPIAGVPAIGAPPTASPTTPPPTAPEPPEQAPHKRDAPPPGSPDWLLPRESSPLGFINGPATDAPSCTEDGHTHPIGKRVRDAQRVAGEAARAIYADVMDGISEDEGRECVERAYSNMYMEALKVKLEAALLAAPNSAQRTFTVVFGGTSVTAGHDNLYNQSYPFAFERMVKCTFEAAGLKLVVRNAAMGFNQGLSYAMCVDEYYGQDADLVFWEMGAMGNEDPGGYELELAMRNFFSESLFPRRPNFYLMGGNPSTREIWGDVTKECKEHCPFHDVHHGKLCPVEACKFVKCKECPGKFASYQQHHPSPVSKVASELLERYQDFGTGAITPLMCTGPLSDKWSFSATKLVRVGKAPSYDAGWHPGPYGHQMMAAIVALKLLKMLDEVSAKVDNMKNGARGAAAKTWANEQIKKLSEEHPPPFFPHPWVCSEEMCDVHTNCATSLEPHTVRDYGIGLPKGPVKEVPDLADDGALVKTGAGQDSLLGFAPLLAQGSAPVHDMREYCSDYSDCPDELSQGSKFSFDKLQEVMQRQMWVVGLMDFTRKAVNKQFGYHNGYRDRKFALMGDKGSDWLLLRFKPVSGKGSVVLCEGPCPHYRCQEYRGNLDKDAEFRLDGEPLLSPAIHKPGEGTVKDGRKDIFQEDTSHTCYRLDVPGGALSDSEHVLGIKATSDKIIMLTSFVWF